MFDDYIRCMSAKQRLHRRRTSLRHIKLQRIAQLLELPVMASPGQQYFSMAPPSFSQSTIASPQGFRARPGGAVLVSNMPLDNSNLLERAIDEPTNIVLSPNTTTDTHRMAAPESCLLASQTSGDQARALASVLSISDHRKTRNSDELIELASDVLDTSSCSSMSSENYTRAKFKKKCPSAPATPRGQRRFGNSEFYIVEWTLTDSSRNYSVSEPTLFLRQENNSEMTRQGP